MLALVALSEGHAVSRARAASLLWSGLERAEGLARLRNTLHHMQQDFIAAGVEPLQIDDGTISLRPGATTVDLDPSLPSTIEGSLRPFDILSDLDGIDLGFDRWLTQTRSKLQSASLPVDAGTDTARRPAVQNRSGEGPSLIMTVFDRLGSGVDDDSARTVTEEVGSALAMLRWITIITRSTKGPHFASGDTNFPDGAGYLLVGTLQRDQTQHRLSLKLLDLKNSGRIVWVGTFLDASDSLFTMQRNIAVKVTATLDAELIYIEANRRKRGAVAQNADAFTLVLLAILDIYRLEKESFLGAGHALKEAIALDPESAFAHTWLAYWNMFLIGQGWATNPFHSMAQAERAANRAIILDPKDARAITISGHVKAFLNRQLDEAAALHELAIQLNPALSLAWHLYGVTLAYAGRLDEAYAAVCRCRDLAPNAPHGFYAEGALGIIHLLRGEYDLAVAVGRRVTERHPQFTSAYKSYLSALGHLGRKSEAVLILQRLTALEPRFSLQRFRTSAHYRRPQDLELFVAGLRLAGLT